MINLFLKSTTLTATTHGRENKVKKKTKLEKNTKCVYFVTKNSNHVMFRYILSIN